jgi:acetyl esterase/lipase
MLSRLLLAVLASAALVLPLAPRAGAQPDKKPPAPAADFTRQEDVIYGRKFGVALTMDVFTPKERANGRGVVFCVSGGWFSSKDGINPGFIRPLLARGYTVFAVVHGSQPKFAIPEVLEDMHRAVRFIRAHAREYGVDPDRLGIAGGSAGGHLSLMQGTAFRPGDPKAKDPVDQQSSRVAAVGCFFPPTDFLNYGKEGEIALGGGTLKNFKAPFDFHEFDPNTRSFVEVTDEAKRLAIGKKISPVYHVSKDSAPALIIHGDADKLVPIQQAELIIARYKEAGVPCELVVKKGAVHGWAGMDKDISVIADWFDKHLGK